MMNPKSVFARVLLTSAVGLGLAVQPASANVRREPSLETVRFRDLDRTENAQTRLRLIRRPATMVCAGSPGLTTKVVSSHDLRRCVWQASSDADGRLDHSGVAARRRDGPRPVQIATR